MAILCLWASSVAYLRACSIFCNYSAFWVFFTLFSIEKCLSYALSDFVWMDMLVGGPFSLILLKLTFFTD